MLTMHFEHSRLPLRSALRDARRRAARGSWSPPASGAPPRSLRHSPPAATAAPPPPPLPTHQRLAGQRTSAVKNELVLMRLSGGRVGGWRTGGGREASAHHVGAPRHICRVGPREVERPVQVESGAAGWQGAGHGAGSVEVLRQLPAVHTATATAAQGSGGLHKRRADMRTQGDGI